MQRFAACILSLVCFLSIAGCGNAGDKQEEESQTTAIGNPWSERESIRDAEEAAGFSFGLPDVIADSYTADEIRTMNNELIEVVYRDETFEVCVRKQPGEGQDLSGDYNEYETCDEESYGGGTITHYYNSDDNAVKQLISYQGYSWSLVAPNGYWGDSGEAFLAEILE